eukprot:gene16740-19089_t
MIQDGRVSVNGKLVTDLGIKVNSKTDKILVDGKKVALPDVKSTFWVAVNKPKDLLTTMRDEKDRDTVLSLVPKAQELHLVPVGGLDRDFTGLMILTNEIGWIHFMTHPAYPHNNRYEVLLEGLPSEEQLDLLREGVVLPGDQARCTPCTVNVVDVDRRSQQSIINILVDKRRAMQLERMLVHINCKVISMKRTEFCGVRLKGLRKGAWRELTAGEVNALKLNCNPASGLAQGYAAAAARSVPRVASQERPKDRDRDSSKLAPKVAENTGSLKVSATHRSPPNTSQPNRAPHRLRPAFRDSSPLSDTLSDKDENSYTPPGNSGYRTLQRESSGLSKRSNARHSVPYGKTKTTASLSSAAGNEPRGKDASHTPKREFDDRFSPQTVRKNAYDRKFTPSRNTAVSTEEANPRHDLKRNGPPKRKVMGAARWLGRASEKEAFKV